MELITIPPHLIVCMYACMHVCMYVCESHQPMVMYSTVLEVAVGASLCGKCRLLLFSDVRHNVPHLVANVAGAITFKVHIYNVLCIYN